MTLTAAAASGSTFIGWSGEEDCGDSSQTVNVTMTAAQSCTATFNASQFTLSLTIAGTGSGIVTLTDGQGTESCSVDCSFSYDTGTVVLLGQDPASGSTFAGWSGDCCPANSRIGPRVIMDAARSVTATFTSPTVEVLYNSGTPIGAFQFGVTGVSVSGAGGGSAEAAGFSVSNSSSIVLGFSFTGNTIPAGDGVLVVLEVEGSANACLTDLIITDSSANALNATVEDCLKISVP